MSVRVVVDREGCIGAGSCVRLARGAFILDEDEIAVVTDPESVDIEDLRLAARSCPSGAILVDEDYQ